MTLESGSSENKARVERYWLMFTPVWGGLAGIVMLSGLAERWGDVELMVLGVGLAVGAIVPPILRERGPIQERTSLKLGASVVFFAFGMNYFCTPFFFEVLGMHYGFRVELTIQNNPVFLYFMTVPYFATYCALMNIAYRRVVRIHRGLIVFVPVAVAFLETALNANPFMRRLFWFDDLAFMLTFGSIAYGVGLACALPVWMGIDEARPTRVRELVVWNLAALMMIVIGFEVLRVMA